MKMLAKIRVAFTIVILLIFLWAFWIAREWPWQARQFPSVICMICAMLCLFLLWRDLFERKQDAPKEEGWVFDLPSKEGIPLSLVLRRIVSIFVWILAFFFSIWLIGFLISVPLFIWLYLVVQGREKWWMSLIYTSFAMIFLIGLFHYIIHLHWPDGLIHWPQEVILEWLGS